VIERFEGKRGRRLLVEALKGQQLVAGKAPIARALAARVTLAELAPGTVLIEEGGSDNDLYFVLAGRVTVLVGGIEIGTRDAGQHVGEVALLDPKAPRSATVVAREPTVVAKITERDFSEVGASAPAVWRALAAGLGAILSERNRRVADPDALRARGPGDAPRVDGGTMTSFLRELCAAEDDRSGWDAVLRPGAVVGRFELVRELGRGGFGVVWEARDQKLGREVAFKAMRRRRPSEEPGQRLLHEAAAAARLSHPNIVTLHDIGRGEYGPYLVLELLRGEPLARRLGGSPLSVAEVVRISSQVAAGLAHAHAHGVVHRDLKPGNVFLCTSGQVKLLDLGIALAVGARNPGGGTPHYMAPEQRRGAPEDERSDVFALGVLMYRMLAGALPFGDSDGAELGDPPPLAVPDAPDLAALVLRMLQLDPTRRPRDAGEVLSELEAIGHRLRPAAPRPRRAPRNS
jgi:CRP-like cAMP-binding protein/tRNA A-37 threonylcarbamoyl transferase component Bud32